MTLRVTGAVIMFVFSLGLCIGSNIYVSSALTELYQLTEEYESITEDKVSHIPYNSDDIYPNVIGTNNKETRILHPLIKREPTMFIFIFFVRSLLLESNLFIIPIFETTITP